MGAQTKTTAGTAGDSIPDFGVKILSGAALKWTAMVTMLIDHIGVILINSGAASASHALYGLCQSMRYIGRLSFPIFAFLLVEGFLKTRDTGRYLARILAFALISEIPFDMMTAAAFRYEQKCNVMFTLFLGLLSVYAWRELSEKAEGKTPFRYVAGIACVGMTAWMAHSFATDYNVYGVLAIFSIYLFRTYWPLRDTAPAAILILQSSLEIWAIPAFILLHYYDGTRGRQPRWLFYIFYPAHMLALGLITIYLL